MAVALPFNQIEKMVQEKLFYKILFIDYLNVDPVFGHGYRMTKDNFAIEILFLKELTIPACNELAGKSR